MQRVRSATFVLLALVAQLFHVASAFCAEPEFPARPISLVVPFAAGGPTDIIARGIAQSMALSLGQPVIVENISGSGGRTASIRTKRAAADGYSLVVGHLGTHAATTGVFANPGYDPAFDFEPVGKVVGMPVVLVGRKGLEADSLQKLIALARRNPLRMGHAGLGSVSHSFCAQFSALAGIKPSLVAFNGTGPAMRAMLAGDVDIMCDQIVTVVPQIKSDAVQAFAVTSPRRSASLPDTPTAGEAGLPEFQGESWTAIFAPKHTPGPILDRLNEALSVALDDAATRKSLVDMGGEIPDASERTPQALRALVVREMAKWQRVLARQAIAR